MKFPFSLFTVYGNSMFPALKPGQDVLIWCWFYEPKVGDMVVIKKNGKDMIKRIQKINKSEVFVRGDNIEMSTNFGPIPRAEIIGKVVWVVR